MRRIAILLAVVGALMLVPVAQALATPPGIKNLTPNNGPQAGGNTVTITGINLTGATKVEFGTTEVTSFSENTSTKIKLVAPAHVTELVNVRVTTPEGTSTVAQTNRYWYRGTASVEIEGTGSGEVSGEGGVEGLGGAWKGIPPIECGYVAPGPAIGVCEGEMTVSNNVEGVGLHVVPAPGSEFAGWTITEGQNATSAFCRSDGTETVEEEEIGAGKHYCVLTRTPPQTTAKVTAVFCLEGESKEACLGEIVGPTNLRTLTATKNANGPGGTGSVSSKPKGIKCGATCPSAVADMYKDTPVELTAKPATGSAFVKWENSVSEGPCDGSTNPVCVVPMSEDTALEAVFSGTSKTITPAEALTVSKGESSGKGTVKGPGLGCEADCSSTVVLYQGPITEPKAKAGKVVVLKQTPAFGSVFSGWSGCESEPEGNCQVAMESAKEVVAEYEALPNKVLTVNKDYAKGNGAVSSKPKGIKCGTTCTQAVAQMPEGAAVELIAKPTTGTFVKWEGGDCEGSTNPVCVVTMNTDETTKAVFSDPGKAFSPAETLTLNKAGSGFGTVKAAGLGCELLCSSTSVIYQGPLTEPKAKPGKTVILKATSAPGSKAVEWTGCDSEPSPSECAVEMDEAHSVTATFDELE